MKTEQHNGPSCPDDDGRDPAYPTGQVTDGDIQELWEKANYCDMTEDELLSGDIDASLLAEQSRNANKSEPTEEHEMKTPPNATEAEYAEWEKNMLTLTDHTDSYVRAHMRNRAAMFADEACIYAKDVMVVALDDVTELMLKAFNDGGGGSIRCS